MTTSSVASDYSRQVSRSQKLIPFAQDTVKGNFWRLLFRKILAPAGIQEWCLDLVGNRQRTQVVGNKRQIAPGGHKKAGDDCPGSWNKTHSNLQVDLAAQDASQSEDASTQHHHAAGLRSRAAAAVEGEGFP